MSRHGHGQIYPRRDQGDWSHGSSASKLLKRQYAREALEAAINRQEKAEEFAAQHGPVRILVANGKPVEPQREVEHQPDAKA